MSINDDAKKEFLKGESWTAIPNIIGNFEKTEETLRLIKLHEYISQLAEVVDPDLVPTSAWENAQARANNCREQLDNNDASRAMPHMEEIVAAIAPFVTNSKDAAQAAGRAFGVYKNAVNDAFDELEQAKEEVRQLNEKLEKVEEYYSELFESTEEAGSKESQIDDLIQEIENYHNKIKKYHNELFGESEQMDDTGE